MRDNDSPSSTPGRHQAAETDTPTTPLFLSAPEALNTTLSLTTGTHRYSKLLILQCAASMFAGSFNMHAISFVNSLPKFVCWVDGREVLSTEEQACLNPNTCRAQYFYDGWVQLYDMTCQQKSARVFFVSLIFVLNASMFFSLNTLGDLLGRKTVLRIATFVAIIGTFLMYYIDNYGMKIILFGMVTGTYSVFQMMFTLGMKEAMPTTTPYNAYMNAIVNCSYNVGPVLLSFLAMVLPFDTLCLASVVLITLCTIPNLFTFFEPPVYLYRKKRLAECYASMVGIARINAVEVSQPTLERALLNGEKEYLAATNPAESGEGVELKQLATSSGRADVKETQEPLIPTETQTPAAEQSHSTKASLKWVTVVLCYWCSCMYLVSYGTLISFEKSGLDNLFVNMILLGVASFIGYGVCIKLPKNVPRIRTISLIMSCLLGVSFFILLLDAVSRGSTLISFIKSVCIVFIMPILVCMGFSVMYLYLPDVFPVTNRGMGIGIVIFIGKSLGGGSSAYIANFMNKMSLNPIAGCAIPSLLLLVLLKTIPQN